MSKSVPRVIFRWENQIPCHFPIVSTVFAYFRWLQYPSNVSNSKIRQFFSAKFEILGFFQFSETSAIHRKVWCSAYSPNVTVVLLESKKSKKCPKNHQKSLKKEDPMRKKNNGLSSGCLLLRLFGVSFFFFNEMQMCPSARLYACVCEYKHFGRHDGRHVVLFTFYVSPKRK